VDRESVMKEIDRAFGHLPRPEPLLMNPNHCCECEEHEETLQKVTRDTISLNEVGSPAWDPLYHVTAETFQYFMPGLARLVLGRGDDFYLDSFLFHLEYRQVDAFNPPQCRALLNLLWHAYESLNSEIENMAFGDCDLSRVIDKLEQRLKEAGEAQA